MKKDEEQEAQDDWPQLVADDLKCTSGHRFQAGQEAPAQLGTHSRVCIPVEPGHNMLVLVGP